MSTVARFPREGGLRRAVACLDAQDILRCDPGFEFRDLKVARFRRVSYILSIHFLQYKTTNAFLIGVLCPEGGMVGRKQSGHSLY